MRLFIPTIGQILELEKEWTVELKKEYRNDKMIEAHGANITFPVKTQFAVDRIYIRQGGRDYDSVTFRTVTEPKGRFWVSLSKANEIEFNFIASKIQHHEILYKGSVVEESSSVKGLITKLKKDSRWSGTTIKRIFCAEVVPLMKDWKVTAEYVGQDVNDYAFCTDVETKTKVPMIAPVDKSKFNKLNHWTKDRNKRAGVLNPATKSIFGGFYPAYRNPSYYWEVEPILVKNAFGRDFMKELRKLKGVKTDEELLQHLPKGYEYKVWEEDN
jgi:hypothetical protein